MFCPQCGASNERDQKFCRQCGQALTAVRLATEGRVDEALEKLRKGEDSLAAGAINLAIFSSFAFVVTLLATIFDAEQGPWPILNIIIGLLIGIPLTVRGILRLERARKILEAEDQKKRAAGELTDQAKGRLPEAPITAPTSLPHATPASVTEHTTYELEPPEQSR
ncbi:MAG TPA: zinc-ribbon domain-containing protein [Blastocatellia bacterium]|nr:zinc-ribbon domain-containing protein [Blastocatellia bacterium]